MQGFSGLFLVNVFSAVACRGIMEGPSMLLFFTLWNKSLSSSSNKENEVTVLALALNNICLANPGTDIADLKMSIF